MCRMSISLCKDLVFLILQFCNEENLKRTAHMLEQETGYFFDLEYFEELVLSGNWEEVEKYLSAFTMVDDNKYSTKIYFEIRKQKFLEALDKHEYAVALDILLKDLKAFAQSNKELYKDMAQLLVLDDFSREHSYLSLYGDVLSARKRILNELRIVIEANPLLHGRTRFPQINKARLRRLINQSLNWQHIHCAHPHPQPHINTLFTDHKCPGPDSMWVQCSTESSFCHLSPLMGNSTFSQTAVSESVITATTVNPRDISEQVAAASVDSKSSNDSYKLKPVKPPHASNRISVPVPLKSVTTERDGNKEEARDELGKVKTLNEPTESTNFKCQSTTKIVQVSRCQSMLLSSAVKVNMIRRLVYTHAGNGILALAEDGTHLLWRWVKSDDNLSGEATMKNAPQLWQPKSGVLMINDLPVNSLDVVKPCFSLSRNDSYIVSTSGGVISLYNMLIFKKIKNVMPAPPAPTCIVFYPPDNNIISIGMDDATILIYNIRADEVLIKLQGHSKRICGLTFSSSVLASCGEDNQIILWDSLTWEMKKSTVLQISAGWLTPESSVLPSPETSIELDKDKKQLLVVHEVQLAIYEVTTLECVKQWTVAKFCTRISHATYSCDSQLVCAAMRDGILLILGASDLTPRFEIDPSAYLVHQPGCYEDPVLVLVVAAHPHKTCQFALGLSNGRVVVIEPFEGNGKWTLLSTPAIPFGQ